MNETYWCVTGAAGFIGQNIVHAILRNWSDVHVMAVDVPELFEHRGLRWPSERVTIWDRETVLDGLNRCHPSIILHMGAITDTTETDEMTLNRWNTEYSKTLWNWAADQHAALFYASSAATYGQGEHGFGDDHANISVFKPLNPYGWSKQVFDVWALSQKRQPPRWVGWKFFNVYGPGESHKRRMASVVFHARAQFLEKGCVRLFRSHRSDVLDGHQKRDFIYIDDVVSRVLFAVGNVIPNGIYNLGTGRAQSFLDLVQATAKALGMPCQIQWIDTPEAIRENYQYWTQADMTKAHGAGVSDRYASLDVGAGRYMAQQNKMSEKLQHPTMS